jgi:hypothetical protein
MGLDRLTDNTITDPDELRTELQTIRERGYAVNDQEHMDGLRAVAVPVSTAAEYLLGSLAVFGPTSRFKDEFVQEELPGVPQDKPSEVKVRLAYDLIIRFLIDLWKHLEIYSGRRIRQTLTTEDLY